MSNSTAAILAQRTLQNKLNILRTSNPYQQVAGLHEVGTQPIIDKTNGGQMKIYPDYSKNEEKCICDKIPDRIWIEVIVPNNTNSTQAGIFDPQPFTNKPIVDNPEQWVLSCQSFTVPAQAIPLTQFGSPNITTGPFTQYGACITWTGTNFTGVVTAIQEDLVMGTGNNSGLINNYQTICDSINNTMNSIQGSILASSGAIFGYGAPYPPYFMYDTNTALFSISADQRFASTGTNDPKLYLNWALFEKFQNFQANYNGRDNANFKDYQVKLQNRGNNVQVNNPPFVGALSSTGTIAIQQLETLYNWNIFQKIAFTSGNIPVAPRIFNNLNNNGGIQNQQNVVADFQINSNFTTNERDYIQYDVNSEFKRFDLTGNTPMTNFSFTVNWIDNQQNFNILPIPPSTSLNVLWLLERKTITRSQGHCKACR